MQNPSHNENSVGLYVQDKQNFHLKKSVDLLKAAQRSLKMEADALLNLSENLTEDFERAVLAVYNSSGRFVVTGIGKSAIVANKIVATLNSTGTPAVFMHAGDAIHGDLGIIQRDDVVMCISQSGNTPEIKVLAPMLRAGGNTLIGMTGRADSSLAAHSDILLLTTIEQEACPLNLAPTTSTTLQMALGDALAIALLEYRGFTAADFARFHPGGALGKRLYLRVDDIIRQNQQPAVQQEDPVKQAIVSISASRLGVTAVLAGNRLVGIITDGDIRRMLDKYDNVGSLKAADIMTQSPKTLPLGTLAADAMEMIRTSKITQVFITDDAGHYAGVVHIHDLIKEGII